jgi:hypothetical protein
MFVEKDIEAAKKAATEAGLSFFEVKTDEQRKAAAAQPEGVVNAQKRFSLSPASRETVGQLGQMLQAATGARSFRRLHPSLLDRPSRESTRHPRTLPHDDRTERLQGAGRDDQPRCRRELCRSAATAWRAGMRLDHVDIE